jgi:hypothetical protein
MRKDKTMNKREIISAHKFPGCQKYWLIKTKNSSTGADIFDVSMGYSTLYIRAVSLKEAEDSLLAFIRRDIRKKIRRAEELVDRLHEFLEDDIILSDEQLLEKYKTE